MDNDYVTLSEIQKSVRVNWATWYGEDRHDQSNCVHQRRGHGKYLYHFKFVVVSEINVKIDFPIYLSICPSKSAFLKNVKIDFRILMFFWQWQFLKQISKKIRTFQHTEFNKKTFTNIKTISQKIKNLEDLYNRSHKYKKVKIDKSYPEFLQKNKHKMRKYILWKDFIFWLIAKHL